jgi:protease-4
MSEFIIRVLKWLAALVTAYFLLFAIIVLLLLGIGIALEPPVPSVEPDSILVLDLGFSLTDSPPEDDLGAIINDALAGEILPTASLRQTLETLEAARKDGDIHGLLLTGNILSDGSGGSFAALRELRRALVEFGGEKPVWAYLENDSLRDYFLKSAATELIADSDAILDFRGLRAEQIYMGEAFKRLGIEVQVFAMEEYKTAYEPLLSDNMSDLDREQLKVLIDEMWASIAGDIADTRGLSIEHLNLIADSRLYVHKQQLTQAGLADSLLSRDAFIEHLAGKVGYDADGETFKQFDFMDYPAQADPLMEAMALNGHGNKLAIAYLDGILIDGESSDGFIGSETIIRYLRELRYDDSVRAVVLRVNSQGGSATASNKVLREIHLLNNEKPVVVSMGGMATSAGYMLSAAGDTIFTEPSTITGSIGVVVMLPNIAGLADKLSLTFDGVETHRFAGTYSLGRAKTEEELRQVWQLVEAFYDDFVDSVAVNRGMDRKQVLELAKGRIWSGKAALELGLADEEGGLMDAVQRAADLAGIGDAYHLIERPRPKSFGERIADYLVAAGISRPALRQSPLKSALNSLEEEFMRLAALYDPHGQYAILPYTLKIN